MIFYIFTLINPVFFFLNCFQLNLFISNSPSPFLHTSLLSILSILPPLCFFTLFSPK